MDFFKYIHAVGTGVKSNRDLSSNEAKDMMRQILNQDIYNEQISAFLLGWRLKPETITEFRSVIEVCDEYINQVNIPNSLELGYPFDGKVKNPYILPLVAKVLEDKDINLVVTGDKLTPAKGGITIKELFSKIDFNSNIKYFDRAEFFKEMSNLSDIRIRLGLRTGLNTIEKLTRIANSDYAIIGVFHKPFVIKYNKIFSNRYKRFAIIQGNEGTPELFSKGRLWISNNGELEEFIINPKDYGINYIKSKVKISLKDIISQIENPSNEFLKLARLNASIYMFVTQKANSIEEAYEILS